MRRITRAQPGIAFAYFGWWLPGRIEGTYPVIWAQMFLRCAKNEAWCRYNSARPNSETNGLLWSIASLRTMDMGLTPFRCYLDENLRGAVVHTERASKLKVGFETSISLSCVGEELRSALPFRGGCS